MSKKHFIAIAKTLKEQHADRNMCVAIAQTMRQFNPNFNFSTFLEACGHAE